ncbi:hypothetical protein KIW84_055818 [Lathyrus oleraceus]|uniref:Uncharacterized protein n=1 Tax=Pisum sativum TaxID=3888 RepID=A0A9D5AIX7_PEA|nr:hypothetical protein KIW84_055818 [Pisum sativum]
MVITYRDWHEMLPFAMHGYRTSVRTSIGVTPYSLVYGMEAVLPVEVEIPSLRVLLDVKLDEAEWIWTRVLPPQTNHRGKWTPNYDGPYIVTKIFDGGALMLATIDGEDFTSPVNSDADRKQSSHLFQKADHLEDLEDERVIAEFEPDRNPLHIAIRLISVFTFFAITSFQGLLPDVNAYSEPIQSIKSCYSVYLCYTLTSRVDNARLYIPSRVDSARLYLPSRSGYSSEFDARSMMSTPDPWSLSLKQNLGTVPVFASPAESSLLQIMVVRTTVAFLSSKLSGFVGPRATSIIIFPISADVDRHESFLVFRPKWHSGQFSDVQIEEVSDVQVDATCGIQASFPVFRPKWHSGQFSDVQIEEVSDVQVDASCGIQASFRYSDRSGIQARFSGVQTEVAFRLIF